MIETREYKFKVQELTEAGQFEGHGSISGNKDSFDDIVESGAFKKTLRENKVFPLLWQHQTSSPIGLVDIKGEDDMGLPVIGDINLETTLGREAYSLLKQFTDAGRPMGLSIGYETIKDKVVEGIRYLKEIKLHEISLVTFPANPLALVSGVKSVVGFQDLPLTSHADSWDRGGAEGRIRKWAGAEDGPNEKYREAFIWCDSENPDKWESYRCQIGDVVDGELKAIPNAILEVAGALQGAVSIDIPEVDRQRARNHIGRYYNKLNRVSPWEEKNSKIETVLAFVSALKADGFDDSQIIALVDRAVSTRVTHTDLEAAVEMVKSFREDYDGRVTGTQG